MKKYVKSVVLEIFQLFFIFAALYKQANVVIRITIYFTAVFIIKFVWWNNASGSSHIESVWLWIKFFKLWLTPFFKLYCTYNFIAFLCRPVNNNRLYTLDGSNGLYPAAIVFLPLRYYAIIMNNLFTLPVRK